MTTLDLEPIKERVAAATPGPWEAVGRSVESKTWNPSFPNDVVSCDVECMDFCYGGTGLGVSRPEDAELIAHAPEDLEALIEEVEMLRAHIAAQKDAAKDLANKKPEYDTLAVTEQ